MLLSYYVSVVTNKLAPVLPLVSVANQSSATATTRLFPISPHSISQSFGNCIAIVCNMFRDISTATWLGLANGNADAQDQSQTIKDSVTDL